MSNDSLDALEQLGLTRLEAMAYVALLQEGPMTAYGVARGIGRPASNTYRLLEGLGSKGLVVMEDGDKRLYRALPHEQMLDSLEQRFRSERDRAARALAALEAPAEDHRVYRLDGREQVLERCRALLGRAEQLVMVDAFPDPLDELGPELEATAARGVKVIVKAYRPVSLAGVEVIDDYRGRAVLESWDGHWLNLVADAREHVLALFEADGRGLRQAVWSGSAYLSWIYHCGLSSEMALDRVQVALKQGKSPASLQRILKAYRSEGERSLPGRRALRRSP